jgi:hypothetical protein
MDFFGQLWTTMNKKGNKKAPNLFRLGLYQFLLVFLG